MMDEKIVNLLKNQLWYLATCDGGEPNAVPVGFKKVADDGTLLIGDVFFKVTLKERERLNLRLRRRVGRRLSGQGHGGIFHGRPRLRGDKGARRRALPRQARAKGRGARHSAQGDRHDARPRQQQGDGVLSSARFRETHNGPKDGESFGPFSHPAARAILGVKFIRARTRDTEG